MSSSTLRVLVVDDSAFNRRTITRIIEEIPGVRVADYATDGEEALRKVFDLKPDLITLDLEMPRMDGFTFLRIVMQNRPTPVIVVSARSEDENVFKALEFGAIDFVAKPAGRISPELSNIRDDLVRKVESIAGADLSKVVQRKSAATTTPDASLQESLADGDKPLHEGPKMVVIGASTGGPPALQEVLSSIDSRVPAAFAVAQHMPPGFTKAFAERLNRYCTLEIVEAQTGDLVQPGRVLIAPGGRNLTLRWHGNQVVAHVIEPEPGQRYIPSVDVLFLSACKVYGGDVLGVVMTGMGNDGARGASAISQAGGEIIAESQDTSVVFGMPKEAINAVPKAAVYPLNDIGDQISQRYK
ncbi:MAG: chemotaxis response regulator protein-glutamate methylesterase [Desulfuromonas sp.]|nr:MAG: chemotaxis response regulator protein-glutamate methylesterase [Desulfuromonas sp.]